VKFVFDSDLRLQLALPRFGGQVAGECIETSAF
jgi:hypothetical protein